MAPKNTLKLFTVTDLVAIIVARFSRWLNCPCRLTDANGVARENKWIGKYGENVAAAWLRSQSCRILATNFRGPRGGEIDIVARQGKLLLFVEVKTRRGNPKIRPFDAVNKEKIALIERGANAWLRKLGTRRLPWRFDVIEVLLEEGKTPHVNQIKNAF